MPDPLLEPRPDVDLDLATRLLADRYGIDARLTELHGERDRNFRADTGDGGRFVLKIHNPADPSEVIDMRTAAMAHVRRIEPGLAVPSLVFTIGGASATAYTAADGRVSQVQVFTFLDGRHAEPSELDEDVLHDWGCSVARLARALRGFFHHAAGYPIQWDVRHAAALRDRVPLLQGEVRSLVTTVLDRFDTRVAPRLGSLRAQVVHNDMSLENVLVDGSARVSGITDFGDTTHTALVCDLAVSLAEILATTRDGVAAAEPVLAGYRDLTPLEPEEARLVADLVAARAATDIVVTTWRRSHHPHADEVTEGSELLLRSMASVGFDECARMFEGFARLGGGTYGSLPYAPRPTKELKAARRRVFGALELSYHEPLHLVRGEGAYLFDADGRRYLDAYNNVPVAGHCHPKVTQAIAAQASLLVTNTRYLHEAGVELATRLLGLAPGGLDRLLFVNSGSEANDIAWRVATFATGHRGALVTRFAYHGVTEATTALSPEGWAEGYAPEHVGLLRPPGTGDGESAGARDASSAVERLRAAGFEPAAFFVDPAFTSDGILGPAGAWIAAAASTVRAAGGLIVGDEVQAGYGRTGEHLWSIAPSGVLPDLMTLGKPMGNGFPVAAVLSRAELVDPFVEATGYFSTFGGNTLACATALAVLQTVEDEHLVENAASVGAHLRGLLEAVAAETGAGPVRSWGLLAGVEVPGGASAVAEHLRRIGVLVGTTGPDGDVLKIRPPLVLREEDADLLAERLHDALTARHPR